MKASRTTEILTTADGAFLGIVLAPDLTAEHEQGIATLAGGLGRPTPRDLAAWDTLTLADLRSDPARAQIGLHAGGVAADDPPHVLVGGDARQWVPDPMDAVRFQRWLEAQGVAIDLPFRRDRRGWVRRPTHGRARPWTPPQTRSAWDSTSFVIATRDPVVRQHLETLVMTALAGDLVCDLGWQASLSQEARGLVIARCSLVPEGLRAAYQAQHADGVALRRAAAATGIAARLTAAGCRHLALAPAWRAADDPRPSASPVQFWLTPWDQRAHACGWYTVEDLEAWTRGEGPVLQPARSETAASGLRRP